MFTGLGGERLWLCPSLNDSANDISGNGNNGSYQGGLTTIINTDSGGSRAYNIDFTSKYIDCGNILDALSQFTISAWVNRNGRTDATGIAGKWNGTGYMLYNSTASVAIDAGPHLTGSQLPTYGWEHLTATYDGTTIRLYQNGVETGSQVHAAPSSTTATYQIGAYLGSGFRSLLDDIRQYSRVLSQAEISHLASARGVQGSPYRPLALKSRVTRLLSNRPTTLLERIRSASKPTTPISIKVKHNEEPSYKAGYAKSAGESENPHLWNGLVGAWMPSLGVTGETLRDVSGNENHGTLTSMDPASDWVTTSKGLALDFDGTGEHVDCGYVLNEEIETALTMACFCTPSVFGGFQNIFSKPFLYWLHQEQGVNRFRFKVRATSGVQYVQADVPITLGQTYFLTGVMSKNTLEIYVDGKFYASQSFAGSLNRSSLYDLKIGGWIGTNDDFTGSIGNASIYNRALSPQEIQELYVDSLAPFRRKKSPIGYQPIKEVKGLIRT